MADQHERRSLRQLRTERIDLAGDRFSTHLLSSRIQLAFSNEMALLSLLQYNHAARLFSTNIRYHWIVRPGSEFFVVYNELDTGPVSDRGFSAQSVAGREAELSVQPLI